MFDNTEDWSKMWRKTDLWHVDFGKFSRAEK